MPELYSYTGNRLATGVKDKFGDVGSVQIDDAMILAWINNGIRQIVAQNPFLKKTAVCNLVAGTAAYDISTAFPAERVIAYHSIVVNGVPIKMVAFSEYLALIEAGTLTTTRGTPQYGTDFGGTLTLWPTPDTTVANGIRIYFSAYPADLTALANTLTVPDRFYNALEDYVFAQALELDENFEAAQIKLGHFEVENQRQFERENASPTDFYPTMQLAPEDYDIHWYS